MRFRPLALFSLASWLTCAPCVGIATSPVVPPAMLAACKGHGAGAPCQFAMGGKSVSGSCQALPDGELACRPGRAPKAQDKKPK